MIKNLLGYIKNFKTSYFIAFLLSIGTSILNLALPYITLHIFDDALTNKNISLAIYLSVGILLITLLSALLSLIKDFLINKINRSLVINLRKHCLAHISQMSGDFFTNYSSGELYTILFNDIENVQSIATTSLFSVVSSVFTAVGLLIFYFIYNRICF